VAEYAWRLSTFGTERSAVSFRRGTFEATAGPLLCDVLVLRVAGPGGANAKHTGFVPQFVLDVDAVLATNSGASVVVTKTR